MRASGVYAIVSSVVLIDVVEVDFGVADGVPGVPGDLEDHERDREADDRVGDLRAERDQDALATTPSETKPSIRACLPSAVIAALASRRPAESRTCAASSFPTNPITPAAASTQRCVRCCGWMKRMIVT